MTYHLLKFISGNMYIASSTDYREFYVITYILKISDVKALMSIGSVLSLSDILFATMQKSENLEQLIEYSLLEAL